MARRSSRSRTGCACSRISGLRRTVARRDAAALLGERRRALSPHPGRRADAGRPRHPLLPQHLALGAGDCGASSGCGDLHRRDGARCDGRWHEGSRGWNAPFGRDRVGADGVNSPVRTSLGLAQVVRQLTSRSRRFLIPRRPEDPTTPTSSTGPARAAWAITPCGRTRPTCTSSADTTTRPDRRSRSTTSRHLRSFPRARSVIERIRPDEPWRQIGEVVCSTWHTGRAVLIGDAAPRHGSKPRPGRRRRDAIGDPARGGASSAIPTVGRLRRVGGRSKAGGGSCSAALARLRPPDDRVAPPATRPALGRRLGYPSCPDLPPCHHGHGPAAICFDRLGQPPASS